MKLSKITEIHIKDKEEDSMKAVKELLVNFIDVLESRCEGDVRYVDSGFKDVDEAFGPWLHDGNFVILAGRPSMGKTSLGQQIAEHVAIEKTVLFYTLETSSVDLVERSVSRRSGVPVHRIKTGEIFEDEWSGICNVINEIRLTNIRYDNGRFNLDKIISKSKQVKAEIDEQQKKKEEDINGCSDIDPPLGLIVVDYLQIVEGKGSDRYTIVTDVSRSLKKLALELDVPILVLAQLNRNVESRPDKRPMMSDLRESGQIEQDADGIFFIYRDDVYNDDSNDKGMAEIICAKNKSGSIGIVKTGFIAHRMMFTNLVGFKQHNGQKGLKDD
jgi:replicative DNA helicase